ncbi:hypothetical protein BC332_24868 [Capsicum chinense]|nr:hypothetical protein BC332_24868 [Capsicum chinense]
MESSDFSRHAESMAEFVEAKSKHTVGPIHQPGTMYNIINKIPTAMVDTDDPGKLVYFYDGSRMQLGAEGFTIGFLYTILGLLLAFVTHVLVHEKNRNIQRLVMFLAIFVSFWAVKKVFYLYYWKLGFGHIYG